MAAQPDVVALIQAADVAVAPSLWPEPLSRSVMEPLACGVPVVATRVGGNPEILTGWLSEYLVEPDDADALAERITGAARVAASATPTSGTAAGATPRPACRSTPRSTPWRPRWRPRRAGASATASPAPAHERRPETPRRAGRCRGTGGTAAGRGGACDSYSITGSRTGVRQAWTRLWVRVAPEVAGSSGHHGRKQVSGTSGDAEDLRVDRDLVLEEAQLGLVDLRRSAP